MPEVIANGITIHYEVQGSGQPLLLIMGLNSQLTDWPDEFVDLLVDRGFQVIRFDNRDIGLSESFDHLPAPTLKDLVKVVLLRRPAEPPYLLSDMADDAAGLITALGLGPTHVVGASMGGMIAQELAIGHPELVRSLTSIMSNTGDGKNGLPSRRLLLRLARHRTDDRDRIVKAGVATWRLISGPHFDESEARARIEQNVARSFRPTGGARQTMAISASPDRTEALGRVTAPTLVIHGLLDRLVKPSGGLATTEAIPGSRLLMLPDMAHDLPAVRHVEMADAIAVNARRADPAVTSGSAQPPDERRGVPA